MPSATINARRLRLSLPRRRFGALGGFTVPAGLLAGRAGAPIVPGGGSGGLLPGGGPAGRLGAPMLPGMGPDGLPGGGRLPDGGPAGLLGASGHWSGCGLAGRVNLGGG